MKNMMKMTLLFEILLWTLTTTGDSYRIGERSSMTLGAITTRRDVSKRNDLVLVTYVFGRRMYETATFETFTKSVAGCGVPVIVVGDPAPPPRVRRIMPVNMIHKHITWTEMVKRFENVYNEDEPLESLRGVHSSLVSNSAKNNTYYKTVDVKPLTPILLERELRDFEWWGYIDNDLWLGDLRHNLVPRLRKSQYDFYGLVDRVKKSSGTHEGPAFGVMTLVRNREDIVKNLLLSDHAVETIRTVLKSSRPLGFSEWGNPKWGYLGYEYSFSGLVHRASQMGLIRVSPHGFPSRFHWDNPSTCHPEQREIDYGPDRDGHLQYIRTGATLTNYSTAPLNCTKYPPRLRPRTDFKPCVMATGSVTSSAYRKQAERDLMLSVATLLGEDMSEEIVQTMISRIKSVPVTILAGSECNGHWHGRLFCHFQYSKHHPSITNLPTSELDKLLDSKRIAWSFPCGLFVPPGEWTMK